MVLQSLRKSVDFYKQKLDNIIDGNTEQLEQLKGLPFYDWSLIKNFNNNPNWSAQKSYAEISENISKNIKTFNHTIGLPQKNGVAYPLFDYEQLLYNELQQHRHLWIKKATGLGVTEFMLRYMAWLCLKNSEIRNSQMCIVTGPRIELAITLIDRMKGLFHEADSALNRAQIVSFKTKETVIELNGVHIEAYPSHHLDSMRGLTNVSFIYLDEADFFPIGQQQDARDVSERYIAKSNPWIVMVSTPNAPDGLFDKIEREPEGTACTTVIS